MKILLSQHQLLLLENESKKSYPVESCALLFGTKIGGLATVNKIVVAPNMLKSNFRFEADPSVVYRAFVESEKEKLDLVAIFHSHPAPAAPSNIDLYNMKFWGETIWLIFSSTDKVFKAYHVESGKISEIPIETLES